MHLCLWYDIGCASSSILSFYVCPTIPGTSVFICIVSNNHCFKAPTSSVPLNHIGSYVGMGGIVYCIWPLGQVHCSYFPSSASIEPSSKVLGRGIRKSVNHQILPLPVTIKILSVPLWTQQCCLVHVMDPSATLASMFNVALPIIPIIPLLYSII